MPTIILSGYRSITGRPTNNPNGIVLGGVKLARTNDFSKTHGHPVMTFNAGGVNYFIQEKFFENAKYHSGSYGDTTRDDGPTWGSHIWDRTFVISGAATANKISFGMNGNINASALYDHKRNNRDSIKQCTGNFVNRYVQDFSEKETSNSPFPLAGDPPDVDNYTAANLRDSSAVFLEVLVANINTSPSSPTHVYESIDFYPDSTWRCLIQVFMYKSGENVIVLLRQYVIDQNGNGRDYCGMNSNLKCGVFCE